MRALVTGATGAVGPPLMAALLASGWQVRALVRTRSPRRVPDAVEVVEGDICDPGAVAGAVAGIDVVFHLAALLHVLEPRRDLAREYARVNVDGTRHLVDGACQAGVRRVVFFSSIAVYGPSAGAPFREDQACQPDTEYGRTKLAAERIVLDARDSLGRPLGTVLRLAAVYGPGIKGNYERLVRALMRGWFVGVGTGLNRRALVSDVDVAAAALLAAEHPAAAGRIYNVADGTPHSLRDIIAAISAALRRRPFTWALPVRPVRWLAGATEIAAAGLRLSPPVRRATIEKYLEDVSVDASAIQQELGFTACVDLAEGWRRVVNSMQPTRAGGQQP